MSDGIQINSSGLESQLPKKIVVEGQEHILALLRVDSWLDDEPETFRLVELDRACELSQNPKDNIFFGIYIPTRYLSERTA